MKALLSARCLPPGVCRHRLGVQDHAQGRQLRACRARQGHHGAAHVCDARGGRRAAPNEVLFKAQRGEWGVAMRVLGRRRAPSRPRRPSRSRCTSSPRPARRGAPLTLALATLAPAALALATLAPATVTKRVVPSWAPPPSHHHGPPTDLISAESRGKAAVVTTGNRSQFQNLNRLAKIQALARQ